MKRLALAAVLLLGGALAAHADNDTYTNMLKTPRSDFDLHQDIDACAARYGAPKNGVPTSRIFKRCMAGRGWRFDHTTIEHTYPDPDDPGLTCKDMKDAQGHVFGSECSNF